MNNDLSRRHFLKVVALSGGSLALGVNVVSCSGDSGSGAPTASPTTELSAPAQINIWMRIDTDGSVTFINPHAEMGQGSWSSLAMIFADEFGANWDNLSIEAGGIHPEFRLNPYVQEVFTAGSSSVSMGYSLIRNAAAAARQAFIQAASTLSGADAASLQIVNSVVTNEDGSISYDLGSLIEQVQALPLPEEPVLKPDSELNYIGKGIPSKEIPSKVSGKAVYGIDYHQSGMLIAVPKASPVHGGEVVSSNADQVKTMAGVVEVVAIPNGLAVVADSFWHAKKGADALEIEFDVDAAALAVNDDWFYQTHSKAVERTDGVAGYDQGDVLAALESSENVYEARYYGGWHAHACMEPMNCTAVVTDEGAELWLGTQGIEYAAREVSYVTGLPIEKIKVNNLMLGGGFGRRYEADSAIQAAWVAKALPGQVVKLIWTREEDTQQDFFRPAGMGLMKASVDENGMPESFLIRASVPAIAAHNPAFEALSKPVDLTAIDGAAAEQVWYEIPKKRFEWVQTESHIRIGWWRSVGNSHNAVFKECFLDELADRAGIDPFEYRRRLLQEEKHAYIKNVLDRLEEESNWGNAPEGHFQGMAMHDTFGTIVGQVIELSVEGKDVHVHKVTCTYDCGSIVNPSTVDGQIRGSIIWGLNSAIMGEINIDQGRVVQSNFHDYPLLRQAQLPEINAIPVLSGGGHKGTGEPGVPPVVPAVANAIYQATGTRYRDLPLSRHGFKLV